MPRHQAAHAELQRLERARAAVLSQLDELEDEGAKVMGQRGEVADKRREGEGGRE